MLFEGAGGGGGGVGGGKNTVSYLFSMEGLIPNRRWVSTSCQVPQGQSSCSNSCILSKLK